MAHPRVELKNPWLAGLLTFLIPGAGQIYQGRYFKGWVYFICIFGGFLFGMSLGEWKVVAAHQERANDPKDRKLSIGYLAQAPVGSLALPALIQSSRHKTQGGVEVEKIDGTLQADFRGRIADPDGQWMEVTGRLTLETANDQGNLVKATFEGVDAEDNEVKLPAIRATLRMDPKIHSNPTRGIVLFHQGQPFAQGRIPRSFWNWFEVPAAKEMVDDLNLRLGKRYEIALVFTWIAGLLNIVAIYDAIEGPAYGYGDEPPPEKKKKKKSKAAAEESAPQEAAASG